MFAAKIPLQAAPHKAPGAVPDAVGLAGEGHATEGHGKVTILLDDRHQVRQVRLNIAEIRGFETFIEGRPYWEVPAAVQRLCGICPVSHHLAAVKAMDRIAGYGALTPTAEKLRRLMHYGQIVQSHAVHFYHLAAPDLLLGFDGAARRRSLVGVREDFPQIATEGVLVRRFGQEVVRATAGKRVHGVGAGIGMGAVPGGMARPLSPEDREVLRGDVDQVIDWAEDAVRMVERLFATHPDFYAGFATAAGNMLALVGPDGGADTYDGTLRARDAAGAVIFEGVAPSQYRSVLQDVARPGSDVKYPHLRGLDAQIGWYRVGPLARMQVCDLLTSEKAETERQRLLAVGAGKPLHGALFNHWARFVELLHAAEKIRDLLDDPAICGLDLMADKGPRQPEAVGVIEAPRGTLLHHYSVDENDRVTGCHLLVSTASNTQAMNEAIRHVAVRHLDGPVVTEGLLAHIEVAIRAYDPCLSCATHALGQLPLEVELRDAGGRWLSGIRRGANGGVARAMPSDGGLTCAASG